MRARSNSFNALSDATQATTIIAHYPSIPQTIVFQHWSRFEVQLKNGPSMLNADIDDKYADLIFETIAKEMASMSRFEVQLKNGPSILNAHIDDKYADLNFEIIAKEMAPMYNVAACLPIEQQSHHSPMDTNASSAATGEISATN
ncbi:hypothetical protein ACH5RR_040712 [Cinchona calisaya]|uniref:Uncharacterized protein n=1 Tax=Cinchona calisaya TaxID=153742 RepID=A0ABD2XWT3_9GENT